MNSWLRYHRRFYKYVRDKRWNGNYNDLSTKTVNAANLMSDHLTDKCSTTTGFYHCVEIASFLIAHLHHLFYYVLQRSTDHSMQIARGASILFRLEHHMDEIFENRKYFTFHPQSPFFPFFPVKINT